MLFRFTSVVALLVATASPPADAAVRFEPLSVPGRPGEIMEGGVWYPEGGGEGLALVLISHGNAGWYRGHRDTAEALARAGMVAAAITHPGDNWRDSSRSFAIWRRPQHLRSLLDYMLRSWPGRGRIHPGRVGAFGFSAGGFTVLAAVGGKPDLTRIQGHCRVNPSFFECRVAAKGPASLLPLTRLLSWSHDRRIRAAVVAAPALGFTFGKQGLRNVKIPVQLWRAEADEVLPHPFSAEAVRRALPRRPDYVVVKNAGHFDFLEPCAPASARERGEFCRSRPGFSRESFHQEMNRRIVEFFREHLKSAPPRSSDGMAMLRHLIAPCMRTLLQRLGQWTGKVEQSRISAGRIFRTGLNFLGFRASQSTGHQTPTAARTSFMVASARSAAASPERRRKAVRPPSSPRISAKRRWTGSSPAITASATPTLRVP